MLRDLVQQTPQELAAIVGAWAPGAVTNADLSLRTRLDAAAPEQSRDQHLFDQACGWLAGSQGIDVVTARQRLQDAAARAGITEIQVARAVLEDQSR